MTPRPATSASTTTPFPEIQEPQDFPLHYEPRNPLKTNTRTAKSPRTPRNPRPCGRRGTETLRAFESKEPRCSQNAFKTRAAIFRPSTTTPFPEIQEPQDFPLHYEPRNPLKTNTRTAKSPRTPRNPRPCGRRGTETLRAFESKEPR